MVVDPLAMSNGIAQVLTLDSGASVVTFGSSRKDSRPLGGWPLSSGSVPWCPAVSTMLGSAVDMAAPSGELARPVGHCRPVQRCASTHPGNDASAMIGRGGEPSAMRAYFVAADRGLPQGG